MTLRRQIAATVALVSFLVAVTLGLLVHRASVNQHVDLARRSAMTALDSALTGYARGGELADWGAVPDDPALPPELRQLARHGRHGSMLGPGTVMWAAAPIGDTVVSVRLDYGQDAKAIAQLDRTILVSAALAVAVTVLAGVLAADRISSRLRTAARTARRIAQGDLAARIGPLGRPRDEVAELAAAVDSMSAVLSAKLASEQRFTADVAHELRTPLTGLLTAAELLPPGRPTELVRGRVRVLCSLTEDLLEVSRLDAGADQPELAPVALGPVVRRAVAAAPGEAEVTVSQHVTVSTDVRRLDRILANLLANAHRHGRAPVRVEVTGATVTVRDHGPGFPEAILREGPQRFRTGARERGHGHGLGLTIARGHAEALGITLRLGNDRGAVAELTLPVG
ncbi:HAMP domain-containing sensor histidine kinase [Kitasatospora sp. NPDC002227]|uniref:sensor histidine kinase n=1 Tax=Kitasatospora sp. NPDC002227 TaxID=3154773 RepID=UPI0033255952